MSAMSDAPKNAESRQSQRSRQTRLLHAGKSPAVDGGRAVNPPVVRASTVLFANIDEQRQFRARRDEERLFTYGARGNPTGFALEDVVSEMEGGYRTKLFPTGLAAIAMTLLSYLKPGDHVLMSDAVYEPARKLVTSFLEPYQIRCTFFAADGSDVKQKLEPNTRVVYAESPGSLVYELCDVRKLAEIAHANDALLVCDNTWGSGFLYRPLELGADVSVIAATKYLGGHSDVMMGTVTTTQSAWSALSRRSDAFGMSVSPDDAYLVLRGIRSLAARLGMHEKHALEVAQFLASHKSVKTVFCPALPGHPGHDIWLRDCNGTNGLLSFEFESAIDARSVEQFADALTLFGIGASWGGFESLVTIADMKRARSVTDWSGRGVVVRLHIGLESPRDLIDDIDQALTTIA